MSMIVDINDFSNGSIDNSNPQDPKWKGTGVFDIIMKAANENIKIQNQTSRITGAEYAEVYLGTMQSAISEAMKFLLNKDQIIKDLDLKQAQIAAMESDTLIKSAQSAKDLEVKTQQILSMKSDDSIKSAQSTKDLDYKQAQINIAIEEKKLKEEQIKIAYVERVIKDKEAAVLEKEISLKEEQIKTAYVERVKKDKEAAVLGMDKVVKVANTSATTEAVYKPKYEEA